MTVFDLASLITLGIVIALALQFARLIAVLDSIDEALRRDLEDEARQLGLSPLDEEDFRA